MGGYTDNRPLVGALVLSLAIKFVLVGIGKEINPDGVLYIAAAREFAAGNFGEGLGLYPMPAFPLLVAAVHLLIPDWVAAARTITIASTVLASIPLYKLGERLFNRRAGFWAVLFLAVAPEVNENALRVVRDPTFLCLALTSVYFGVRGLQSRQLQWIAFGFAFAAAALLFRIEGIVLLALPAVAFLLIALGTKDASLRSFAGKSMVLWIGIPVCIGILVCLVFGSHFLTQNRIDELSEEVQALFQFSAFDKYLQIYAFFKKIQADPPFSGFSHSLPATVRHWMPLIYGIGFMESLVKQLYPLFVLPLMLHIRNSKRLPSKWTAEKCFVLAMLVGYLLFLYYFLITRDRMVGRLLLTPAILLFPWVGNGFAIGLDALKHHRFAVSLRTIFVILFLVLPSAESAQDVIQSDRDAMMAGRFIADDPNLENAAVLFNDVRLCFYAHRFENFSETLKVTKKLNRYYEEGRYDAIEAVALEYDADAFVLFVNAQKNQKTPFFKRFSEYKRVIGDKGATIIYRKSPR